ncbi:MAG: toll/interleukin-1 receptor domain-containing protein, partial [Anaerolineae bacterium]|nr:toll/interleukin-1 receptor domain-containing protein [Anaerolineae bacterium]
MSTVFMSYSHKDQEYALSVKQQLTAAGFDVWFDTSKLEAGYQWKTHILEAIRTCSAMVVIATPNSAASHWVMREISYAVEFDKLIIPLLAPQDKPPLIFGSRQCAYSVDEVIQGLQHLPRLFICHTPEDGEFVERLEGELGAIGAIFWHGSVDTFRENLKSVNIILLLVISPEAVKSSTVQAYYQIFTQAGYRRAIIPLLVRHSTVSPELRGVPYIDFLNQSFEIAFKQLYGRLVAQRVKLVPYEMLPIPPQPPLLLDGIGMFRT